ncbi:MAG: PEP-CTERM sorting domain-containing protein [Planctomycetota bacterium]
MLTRLYRATVLVSALLVMVASAQLAQAALPNLGMAPGEGAGQASGLVIDVVLPALGAGETGQALSPQILEYLAVDAPIDGVVAAGGAPDLTGLPNAVGRVPVETLPGDVVLPALEAGDRGEALVEQILAYLEVPGNEAVDVVVAGGAPDLTGLPNAVGQAPAGTLAGDVVLPALQAGDTGQALVEQILAYLGVPANEDVVVVDLVTGPDAVGGPPEGDPLTGLPNAADRAPIDTLAGDVVLPALVAGETGETLVDLIHDYLGVDGGAPIVDDELVLDPMDAGTVALGGMSMAAVPEPATLGLLSIGALALVRRKRF